MYGMGGYGGYSGMGGYGSSGSYLGGGGYGSSYGGYGGTMGGYGSSNLRSSTALAQGNKTQVDGKGQNIPDDPNNPQRQKMEEISQRKMLFEEWFKMMGGLRSILELGFAAIALANFWTRSSEIFKRFLETGKHASKSLATFIQSKIPTKIFSNLANPQKRGKALKSVIMMVVRVFAGLLFCLGVKLQRDIKKQVEARKKEMEEQLSKMKQKEIELIEQHQQQEQHPMVKQHQALQQANL